MPADIEFPKPCVLCCYFMLPEDAQVGRDLSPGIGHLCADCSAHVVEAVRLVLKTPGIAKHMIEDGERNDICPPRFLREKEDQP